MISRSGEEVTARDVLSAFVYYCPECGGGGERIVDTDPRDPASSTTVRCWMCDGDGTVTMQQIEAWDQVNAERCEDYTPPVRELTPAPRNDTTPHPPVIDPWATDLLESA